jgi:aspartoacylase
VDALAQGMAQGMANGQVLVVAGTHGNERNAPWLLEQWRRHPDLLASAGVPVQLEIGNPEALQANRRYLDRDLNRCFAPELLADAALQQRELQRARRLLELYGSAGQRPCRVALDLHSTTSGMGNSLVVYGRRPSDLALAAGIQARLGLPVYLHEADAAQTGFLVERWPCGLVIEVGPVAQGLLSATIARQTQLALEAALLTLAEATAGRLRLPSVLQVHCHRRSVDLPRDSAGEALASVHPRLQNRDWPLEPGLPLFWSGRSEPVPSADALLQEDREARWPVFINEAAYGEKGIAFSLCRRERWDVEASWAEALQALMAP